MATGDVIASGSVLELLQPLSGGGYPDGNYGYRRPIHKLKRHLTGLTFPARSATGYEGIVRLNQLLAAAGNLTVRLSVIVDPYNDAPGNTKVRMRATVKRLVSGTDNPEDTGAGTPIEASVTLDPTSGEFVTATIALTNAEADAIAAKDLILLKLERDGMDTEDTFRGTVIVTDVQLEQT